MSWLDATSGIAADTALLRAAHDGDLASIRTALDGGASIDCCDDAAGCTPLHWAATKGHAAAAELLVARGARLAAVEGGGKTPLQLARDRGHAVIATSLEAAAEGRRPKAKDEAPEAARRALDVARRGGCVPWRRGCLLVMGSGGQGKTCTIKALSGQPFDMHEQSTPGTSTQVVELERQNLELFKGSPMRGKAAREGGDVVDALATYAQLLKEQQGQAGSPALDAMAAEPATMGATAADGGGGGGGQAAAEAAGSSGGAPAASAAGAAGAGEEAQAATVTVAEDLVIRYVAEDAGEPGITVSIFDCGGQDVFRDMHDIFQSGQSAFLVVLALPDVLDENKSSACIENVRRQLDSISVHCAAPKVLLVGTCAGQLDERQLEAAAATLERELARTSPAFKALVENEVAVGRTQATWLFPVENSVPFAENVGLRALAAAIERTISALPAMQKPVPIRWLQVHDRLQALQAEYVSVEEVRNLARAAGLPHGGLCLEEEVASLLEFLHSLGCLFWFNIPGLSEIVVLNPQWILDGVTAIIRTYGLHKHPSDRAARRQFTDQWDKLTQGEGTLHRCLLPFLWGEPRFKNKHKELLQLMINFGLAVELRGTKELLVPSLLKSQGGGGGGGVDEDGPHFFLHFSFQDQLDEQRLLWNEKEADAGFMPTGVYRHVGGACVAWTYHTTRGFEPRMTAQSARVAFGSRHLVISHDRHSPMLRISVSSQRDANAVAVVERVIVLVEAVLQRHYPNLKVRTLLPLGSVDSVLVHREELLKLEPHYEVHVGSRILTGDQLRQELSLWIEPKALPNYYHIFISYRWGERDSPFVDKVVDCLRATMLGQQHLVVFQDRRRLRAGEEFDIAFMTAASRTLVIAPVISWDALARMTSLKPGSPCDNVLLEWSLCLWLSKRLEVKILPLFVGTIDKDGQMRPFFAGPDWTGDTHTGSPDDRFPDVVVQSVVDRLQDFADRQGWELPEEVKTRSVRTVFTRICKFMGVFVNDIAKTSDAWGMHEGVAKEIFNVVQQQAHSPEGAAIMGQGPPALPSAAPPAAAAAGRQCSPRLTGPSGGSAALDAGTLRGLLDMQMMQQFGIMQQQLLEVRQQQQQLSAQMTQLMEQQQRMQQQLLEQQQRMQQQMLQLLQGSEGSVPAGAGSRAVSALRRSASRAALEPAAPR